MQEIKLHLLDVDGDIQDQAALDMAADEFRNQVAEIIKDDWPRDSITINQVTYDHSDRDYAHYQIDFSVSDQGIEDLLNEAWEV